MRARFGNKRKDICVRLSRLVWSRNTYKGLLQDGWDADLVDCAGMVEIRIDLTHLHVLGIPPA